MLLRISASNYLSIADRQELSLVATKLKGPEVGLLDAPITELKVLPSAIIYGANASGKSNFLKAMNFMRWAILFSHRRANPEGGVPRQTFALDTKFISEPTSVEADFIVEGIRYQYGFECDDERFLSEWLYAFPEGKQRKLFERNREILEFGQSLRGQKKILASLMRPNSLFLSTATQNHHDDLSRIVSFFKSIRIVNTISAAKELINNTIKKDQIDPRAIEFLKNIGTGIVNFRQMEIEIPENIQSFQKEVMILVKKHVGDSGVSDDDGQQREKDVSIELAHRGIDGLECFFGLERESTGTRRLLLMLSSVLKSLDTGSIVLIDELDASLHTHAAEQILLMFADKSINKNRAQLISTTHDTNLLNCSELRRDQIWFCEKDDGGATHLFPLSDIKSRPSDNFEQGYLEGRYGAIPYSGNLRSLVMGTAE